MPYGRSYSATRQPRPQALRTQHARGHTPRFATMAALEGTPTVTMRAELEAAGVERESRREAGDSRPTSHRCTP